MSNSEASRLLISVLQEREIALGSDDVNWAFESAQTREDANTWLARHIHPDTLLTKDEVELHEWLEATGRLPCKSVESIKPVLDQDLRHVIRALEASTAGIDKQTRLLETQKDALLNMRRHRQQAIKAAQDAKNQIRGQRLHESSRLGFTIEEVEQDFNDKLETLHQELDQGIDILFNGTDDHLRAHDSVLEALAQLASRTRGPSLSSAKPSEVDAFCRKLVEFRTREMQARFDLLLQEQLIEHAERASPNSTNGNGHHSPSEVSDLQNEIETLKQEIESVVEVVVASEVRQPLLKAMRAAARTGRDEQTQWSEYVYATLKHMIAQTQVIQEHAADLGNYASALDGIQGAYAKPNFAAEGRADDPVIKSSDDTAKRHQRPPMTPTSSSFSGLSSTSIPTASKSKELSMVQILSRFDIASQSSQSSVAKEKRDSQLSESTSAALSKLASQYQHALQADLVALSGSLGERDREFLLLEDNLFAFTSFADIKLVDQSMERKIDELDESIKRVAAVYADVEARSRTTLSSQGADKLLQKHSS